MPTWVAIIISLNFIIGWGVFLYTRKLARDDGSKDDEIPHWFGGIQNWYTVPAILKKHSKAGDSWAGRAYWIYCLGSASVPVLIVVLAARQFWPR